jgi:uncharacterized protein YdbL (DUF1318 family)
MRQIARRTLLSTLAALPLLAALAAAPAWAESLDALRASGQVGERYDGYAEARDGSVAGFVADINAQRRQEYERIANQQGISVEDVGKVAAQKIRERLPSGAWFLGPDGQWRQL